jgi:basic membrane lipoprotein Med (substrate-binding protein (PBP1-ABC) superfamily)
MSTIVTNKNKPVIAGKIYELKYKFGNGFRYGIGWVNPESNHNNVDILCHEGGVTYQDIENVVFIKQVKQ